MYSFDRHDALGGVLKQGNNVLGGRNTTHLQFVQIFTRK